MGMSKDSMGIKSIDNGLIIQKKAETDKVIALAGNPNVGKSTVFNQLTGMNQHTGCFHLMEKHLTFHNIYIKLSLYNIVSY